MSRTRLFCATFAAAMSLTSAHTALAVMPGDSSPGTRVGLRLEMDLRSGQDKVGEPVLFTVTETVYGPHHSVLLEKGSIARGHIVQSSKRGAFGRDGKLAFTCDYALARDGTHVPLLMSVEIKSDKFWEQNSSVGEIGATATAGINTSGYSQSPAYYNDSQETGLTADGAADAAHLLASGDDETAPQGHEYQAVLANTLPLASASLPSQTFILKDKTQLTGTLLSFVGGFYLVKTSHGSQSILATDIGSIAASPDASRR